MEVLALCAVGAVVVVLVGALVLAERRVELYADESLILLGAVEKLRAEHAQERTEWAAAAADERRRLTDEAAAERAGLINALLAARGEHASTVASPWPVDQPAQIIGDDELTERARAAQRLVDAELAAREQQMDAVS